MRPVDIDIKRGDQCPDDGQKVHSCKVYSYTIGTMSISYNTHFSMYYNLFTT